MDRHDRRVGNDDDTQAGDLFRLMTAGERGRLVGDIAESLQHAPREIQPRHFFRADPSHGMGVANGLGVDLATPPNMNGAEVHA